MTNKIPLNGFGRMGRLIQTFPYLTEPYHHIASATAMEMSRREAEATDNESIMRETAAAAPLRLDPTDNPNTYTIYSMPELPVRTVYSSPLKMRNRYEGRQFPKDYAKRKKNKARQQKQSRKKNRR